MLNLFVILGEYRRNAPNDSFHVSFLMKPGMLEKKLLQRTTSKSQAGQSDVLVTEKQFDSHKTQQKPYKQLIQHLDTSEKHTYLFGKILLKK